MKYKYRIKPELKKDSIWYRVEARGPTFLHGWYPLDIFDLKIMAEEYIKSEVQLRNKFDSLKTVYYDEYGNPIE